MQDVLKTLNDLISTSLDSAEGFAKAAKGAHSDSLRDVFGDCARRHQRFGGELAAEVRRLGGEPAQDGHGGGVLHRGWLDLEQRIRPKDDAELLADCQHGEAGAILHYQHALDGNLSTELLPIVERQLNELVRVLDRLRGVEGTRAAH